MSRARDPMTPPRPATFTLSQRQSVVLNAAVFQLAWLACVIGGTAVAIPVTAAVLAMHLWWSSHHSAETVMLVIAIVFGLACETLLIRTGVLQAPGLLPPIWLLCLWPLFATTLGLALRWFRDRLLFAAAGGMVFAPLSYFGGSRLAGIELLQPDWLALLIVGMVWLFVFPSLSLIHRRLLP